MLTKLSRIALVLVVCVFGAGAAASVLDQAVPIATTTGVVYVRGPVSIAAGGTGISSYTVGDLLYASATTTLSKLACATAGTVLQGGAPPSCTATPTVTALTAERTALGTTSTDGILAHNTTAALVGTPVQISPRIRTSGRGWDVDDAVSRTVSFFSETLPVSGNTVSGTWKLGFLDPITSAITYPATVTSSGTLTVLGNISAGSQVIVPSGGFFATAARGYWSFPADGRTQWQNNDGGNTFNTTLADWGTTLGAEAVSYAQDAVQNIGTGRGLLSITIGTANATCLYVLSGTATAEVSDPDTLCTVTKGNAATVNISWQTDHFEIENKIAGTRTIRAVLIGG